MSKRSSDEDVAVVAESNGAKPSPTKKPRLDPDLPDVCLFFTTTEQGDKMLLKFNVASTPKAAMILEAIKTAQAATEFPEGHISELMHYICIMMDKPDEQMKKIADESSALVLDDIKALTVEEFGKWEWVDTDVAGPLLPTCKANVYVWNA